MKDFLNKLLRFIIIGLIPFVILTAGYLILDPFKVLRSYNNYSQPFVIPNRDYISTETFLKNIDKQQYNSFIFGSSRTIGINPVTWQNYLQDSARPFMFDASAESLHGIYQKINFLKKRSVHIRHALILFDRDITFVDHSDYQGHLFIKHPVTSGESKLKFQLSFFKAYLTPGFLFCYYSYLLTGTYRNYMTGYIENRKIDIDSVTNQVSFALENQIKTDSLNYYLSRKNIFYNRLVEKQDSISRIDLSDLLELINIKMVFNEMKTEYKIILSPLYEQVKFNERDRLILKSIFGKSLYDFTGKNFITNSAGNYYEPYHFRPGVGDMMLRNIYVNDILKP